MAKAKFPEYEAALAKSRKGGVSNASGDALLALTCEVLGMANPIVPGMLFNGAKKRGLDSRALRKLAVENVAEFAFLQFE